MATLTIPLSYAVQWPDLGIGGTVVKIQTSAFFGAPPSSDDFHREIEVHGDGSFEVVQTGPKCVAGPQWMVKVRSLPHNVNYNGVVYTVSHPIVYKWGPAGTSFGVPMENWVVTANT